MCVSEYTIKEVRGRRPCGPTRGGRAIGCSCPPTKQSLCPNLPSSERRSPDWCTSLRDDIIITLKWPLARALHSLIVFKMNTFNANVSFCVICIKLQHSISAGTHLLCTCTHTALYNGIYRTQRIFHTKGCRSHHHYNGWLILLHNFNYLVAMAPKPGQTLYGMLMPSEENAVVKARCSLYSTRAF